MDELNYFPNMLASNLRSDRATIAGIVVPRMDSVYVQMIEGIFNVFEGAGIQFVIKKTDDFKNRERVVLKELLMLGVKGIFIVTCDGENSEEFDRIQKMGIPMVFLDRSIPGGYVSFIFDNRKFVYEKVKELLFRAPEARVALITGPVEFDSEAACAEGYKKACEDYDIQTSMAHVPINKQQAFAEILDFMNGLKAPPEYMIVTNHMIADALREVIFILDAKPVHVYALDGDDWYGLADNDNNIRIHRNAILCGELAAKKMRGLFDSHALPAGEQTVLPMEIYPFESIKRPAKRDTIRLLAVAGLTMDSVTRLLPDFTDEFGVRVEYDICGNHEELYSRILRDKKSKDDIYDVYMIDYLWNKDFAVEQYLYNMSGLIGSDNDHYMENFIPFVRQNSFDREGRIFAVPVAVGSQMLLYRKDLFENNDIKREYYEQCGLELKEPASWDEFNMVARFFTREYNAGSPVKYGTCLMGYNPHGLIEEFLPRLWAYKSCLYSGGESFISSPKSVRALQNLCGAYRYSYPDIHNFMETEQMDVFAQGDTAMVNTFSIHIPSIYNVQMEKLVTSLGICMLPGRKPLWGEWQMAINSRSPNVEESYAFIKWVTGDRLCVHNTALGGFIPKKKVLNNKELDSIYPWKNDIEDYINTCRHIENVYDRNGRRIRLGDIYSALGEGIGMALYGKKTEKNALLWVEERLRGRKP
jgi:ABC-type glycerol-3-phosphate transport system substrate-binding protein